MNNNQNNNNTMVNLKRVQVSDEDDNEVYEVPPNDIVP